MNILFLHTLSSNTELFDPLASARFPQHNIQHDVQEHFLTTIREQGQTPSISDEIHQYISSKLASGFNYIICTCSTLGSIVDAYPSSNVFRVDKPMAESSSNYSNALVAVTLQSTIQPSKALLESVNSKTHYEFLYIEDAWDYYTSKQFDAFNQCIAEAIDYKVSTCHHSYDVILLAQASMINAMHLLTSSLPVITSPDTCLTYLESVLEGSPAKETKEDN